jgi:hypothetical protein
MKMDRLLCYLAVSASCFAATPLFRATFEIPEKSWAAVRGSAVTDPAVLHEGKKSLRMEAGGSADACVQFAPVSLTIGKRYELSGWARTEHLTVRDLGRSPIAIGAALTMASMPFDVHSAALGGATGWTRLSLKFVASRTADRILLTAGNGGAVQGKAWFEGISLIEISGAEISDNDEWPIREAVQTFGPAYRYPAAGWIYLHIEGKPYERGYQHGHLMAREIPEYLARCADDLGGERAWSQYRLMANAVFLRGFDREILEEMRGIADGASDAGAQWRNERIDLVDMVVANVTVEMGELRGAMKVTPTGLEGLTFDKPPYAGNKHDHCSAFAATGSATRDGKMIVGHVTWWPLTLAEQTNVMLDIQPEKGHRILMQSYPGGIESGTDWYQNDAGMVLTETTLRQTPFNAQGTPVAFRARMAIQYGGNVDEVVAQLGNGNNGLYTNEWIVGDAKNNEIAMYELGTTHTKLWRSSKDEWFGGTPGFYWGDNNAKDLTVNLEYQPDPKGPPAYVPYVPAIRDLAWQDLYRKYRGQIDEQFAFLAFRSAPLVAKSTMDAKVATADLASHLMLWGEIGRPNQREWVPQHSDHTDFAMNDGLYPSGYYLFSGGPPANVRAALQAPPAETGSGQKSDAKRTSYKDRLWKGWVLPASDADTWLVRGSEKYYEVLRSDDVEKLLEAVRAGYRRLKLEPENAATHFSLEGIKGVLFLDALRRKLGDDPFFKLMSDFFGANSTKTVTAQSFLDRAGVSFAEPDPGKGAVYVASDIGRRLSSAVLVYGTLREAGANRYAAECLQRDFLNVYETEVPIYKDFEATDEVLQHHDVIFVGRPEANSAVAAFGVEYRGASFRIAGNIYASEREALLLAAQSPLDPARMVLVVAGNDALRTVKLAQSFGDVGEAAEYIVLDDSRKVKSGFVP